MTSNVRSLTSLRLIGAALVLGAVMSLPAGAQAPANTPGVTRTPIFDNEKVTVNRVTFAPGAREVTHTHPTDVVIIQQAQGSLEVTVAGATQRGQEPGKVFFVPKQTEHSAGNPGTQPMELFTVPIK